MSDDRPDPLPSILLYGFLNLLAGASGIGKTALLSGLLVRFRDGLPIFGRPTHRPAGIGYITADRSWADSRLWFEAAGYPEIPQYSIIDDPAFRPGTLRQRYAGPAILIEAIAHLELPPDSLIVIDPVALFLGGNLLDYREVAVACIEIQRYARAQRYCLWGLCHTAKLKADVKDRYARPQDRILGSTALLGYTATQMYLMAPEETGTDDYTFLWNPHHAPQETFTLTKGPTGLFQLETPQTATATSTPAVLPALEPDLATLYQVLPDSDTGIGMGDICQRLSDLHWSRSTIWRRLKTLQTQGVVETTPTRHWRRCAPSPP